MVVGVVATRVGRSYLQLEKLKSGKVKTKKMAMYRLKKIKTKTLQMKVFELQA